MLKHNIRDMCMFCFGEIFDVFLFRKQCSCPLDFRLFKTFCNNISLTFHPMQDSAIFCTFFPVSLINCTKYFETLAELSSGVKIGSIRAMEFVHNHSISLCASKRRSPKKWKQIKSFAIQSRFWPKTLVVFLEKQA